MRVGSVKDPKFYRDYSHDDDEDGGSMTKMTSSTVTPSPNKNVNLFDNDSDSEDAAYLEDSDQYSDESDDKDMLVEQVPNKKLSGKKRASTKQTASHLKPTHKEMENLQKNLEGNIDMMK